MAPHAFVTQGISQDAAARPGGESSDEKSPSSSRAKGTHLGDFPNLTDGKVILGHFLKLQIPRPMP